MKNLHSSSIAVLSELKTTNLTDFEVKPQTHSRYDKKHLNWEYSS